MNSPSIGTSGFDAAVYLQVVHHIALDAARAAEFASMAFRRCGYALSAADAAECLEDPALFISVQRRSAGISDDNG